MENECSVPLAERRLDIPSDSLHDAVMKMPFFSSATPNHSKATMDNNQFTIEMAQEFHRNMAAIIDAVQVGIWQKGVRDLLGYSTDFALGQKRGLQTLILKTGHKSAYVRLHWDNILGISAEDRQLVTNAVQKAIQELC